MHVHIEICIKTIWTKSWKSLFPDSFLVFFFFGCIIWEELGRCTQGGHETKMGKGKGEGKEGGTTQHSLLVL